MGLRRTLHCIRIPSPLLNAIPVAKRQTRIHQAASKVVVVARFNRVKPKLSLRQTLVLEASCCLRLLRLRSLLRLYAPTAISPLVEYKVTD